ncbi:pyruvate:ferredoxin (flavodoxin) oxidoreductase [Clostridium sp. D2Q-11]|uniref:Pyruvate:ferredoxin (Flavodoxin) oxidoreductase n=1 Tax=Anaeromonas frigoriresistens TaxID=2683708 RepID=A0A942UV72_9FIRM|nr:pyruvate:ferredoxin (flavodoxin) oxidoreductase [Anaeromonas frigoriresistens]MBS4537409.1 pyruvate:ferredoxin (flavodoxin) oxidoreductase [Anaeromonas frigoriresistens]
MAKVMKTMDGNTAAAYVSYAFTDVAAIYPITPSSPMAEYADDWSAHGKNNIFGQPVKVTELQSEGGASGAVHGALQGGALTTTFTASQGLLLMIPNMYKIAGELLPGVFHVSARAVASHALSIFGDHSDVMAARQTGFALLASGSVQEVMDLGGVAHLASIKSRIPFLHFFDGFRTSHEVQKIEVVDYDEFAKLVDYDSVKAFRKRSLNPERPVTRGTAQNPDIFFQARESSNRFYNELPAIVEEYMKEISKVVGREYKPFNYYGAEDAEKVIIAMGSVTETIEETVDYLVSKGEKVGVIKVHLYRPFCKDFFFNVLPKTVNKIAVLDRTKEPGSLGEPLYQDVRTLFYDEEVKPLIIGGRYGLGSKDTTPSQIKRVFDELNKENPKNGFTIGINDDVTHTSLSIEESINTIPEGTIRCKFWGLGSDGTVGANKNAIKIIGDNTDLYAQGYFSYDSKKSGGVTVSHLRFGKQPIKSTYLIDQADFISCSTQSYVDKYDLLKGLKKGGTFLLNTLWSPEELENKLPASMKKFIADNEIKFYTINATEIAQEIGLGHRTNMIMQSAFFKLAEVIDLDEAIEYLNGAIVKSYGKKGEKIVKMNQDAVQKGIESLVKIDVPEEWVEETVESQVAAGVETPDFIKNILEPVNRQEGDLLPVSTFLEAEDGTFQNGSAKFEKRGIAVNVPEWIPENCIQCNQCSFVCPHATIRPILIDEEEMERAPEDFETLDAMGKQFSGLKYKIQISTLDCTGCGNCADICPAKEKALVMEPIETQTEKEVPNWDFAMTVSEKKDRMNINTVKGSQFAQPLLEFSGACAGCGETPYAKAVTQLYGDRMIIANATGCSSIWGGSAPSTPYCVNSEGKGPAWANSLFEDNAEYGYGMAVAVNQLRNKLELVMKELIELNVSDDINTVMNEWIEGKEDAEISKQTTAKILPMLKSNNVTDERAKELLAEIEENKDYLIKKSVWIVGGDGWAYDIGYGGLDHVLASGEDVNVLVFDTEIYSNTGGQSSKATPTAAVAQFAASGKRTKKKDLGMIATTYGYVYVAQVAMGANKNQFMKALVEAESYKGPSLIIAYAPCISHGIKAGMGKAQEQQKNAVEAGYWHLYRYNPELKGEGKNPFVLDSKEPTASFKDFLMSEVRYTTLSNTFPEVAEELFDHAEEDAKERYANYRRMAEMKY